MSSTQQCINVINTCHFLTSKVMTSYGTRQKKQFRPSLIWTVLEHNVSLKKRHLMIEQTFKVVRQSLQLLSCFFNSQSYIPYLFYCMLDANSVVFHERIMVIKVLNSNLIHEVFAVKVDQHYIKCTHAKILSNHKHYSITCL